MSQPSGRKVTLKDIAAQAGVSVTAVSHVMNNRLGHVRVSPAKRGEILAIARHLGYVPNRIARSMVGQRSHTLGVVGALQRQPLSADRHNAYFLDVLVSIESVATRAGYNCLFITSDMSDPQTFTPPQAMRDGSVDGVILVGHTKRAILDKIIPLKLPCAQVGSNIEVPDAVHCIYADLELAFEQSAERLMAMGHRDIALLLATGPGPAALARHFEALPARLPGLRPQVLMRYHEDPDDLHTRAKRMARWLLDQPRRASAVITHALFAQPLTHELAQAGLHCPRDISLMGYGETAWGHLYGQGNTLVDLSYIELPVHLTGKVAALHLLRKLGDDQCDAIAQALALPQPDTTDDRADHRLPCTLHWRQSTAPCR